MPIEVKNLIIFGDSMSDIGNKREQGMGIVARGLGLMRTNAVGRFSDTRNWTDLLWEWAGGSRLVWKDQETSLENTVVHRTLTVDSNQDSGFGRPFYYCNYAEGGAMGASDRSATGLGTFKDQLLRYIAQRDKFPLKGPTLHILWFGLNDLVTNARPPDKMDGVVDEMGAIMKGINMKYGMQDEHFLVVNLPSPAGRAAVPQEERPQGGRLARRGRAFLQQAPGGVADGYYYDNGKNVTLVDMYSFVNTVNDNLEAYKLSMPHNPMASRWTTACSATAAMPRSAATSRRATTPTPPRPSTSSWASTSPRPLRTRYSLGKLSSSKLL